MNANVVFFFGRFSLNLSFPLIKNKLHMHVGILPQVPNKRNICKIPKSKKLEEHWDSVVTQLFDNKWLHYGTNASPKMPHKWLTCGQIAHACFHCCFLYFSFFV
jgi:hypothetical protein